MRQIEPTIGSIRHSNTYNCIANRTNYLVDSGRENDLRGYSSTIARDTIRILLLLFEQYYSCTHHSVTLKMDLGIHSNGTLSALSSLSVACLLDSNTSRRFTVLTNRIVLFEQTVVVSTSSTISSTSTIQ